MKRNSLTRILSLALIAAVFAVAGFGASVAFDGTARADTAGTVDVVESTTYIESVSPAIAVYEKCSESVVGVITSTETWSRSTGEIAQTKIGEGSGVVLTADGYILTNNHVVEDGNYYEILLSDGETVEATLVGTDAGTDLAVLKVDDVELKPIEIGSSSDLRVGETVIAIGNPGGSVLANSVTQGIVSALERDMANTFKRTVKTIQHDAAINPGNSGGALLNARGQLVGINTLKLTGSAYSSTTYEGLGFAIPIDLAYPLAQQLIEYGEVRRPALGIMCMTFQGPDEPLSTYPAASVLIDSVTEGGPAEQAGLQALDFITAVDGQRVTSLTELTSILDEHEEGDTVKVTVLRYENLNAIMQLLYSQGYYGTTDSSNIYGGYGYGFGSGYGSSRTNSALKYDEITLDVTLQILGSTTNQAAAED